MPGNAGYRSPFDYSDEDVDHNDDRGQFTGANYDDLTDESYNDDANGIRTDTGNVFAGLFSFLGDDLSSLSVNGLMLYRTVPEHPSLYRCRFLHMVSCWSQAFEATE